MHETSVVFQREASGNVTFKIVPSSRNPSSVTEVTSLL